MKMPKKTKVIDNRLVGTTAENIFLSLLNQHRVFATSFDTAGLDGIVYDNENRFFKIGKSPFYVQIKCRGSNSETYNPQGHSPKTIQKIKANAQKLLIPESSQYFVVGFFNNNDIRKIIFYTIPFELLPLFKTTSHYRFSVIKCRKQMHDHSSIFEL